MAIPRKALYDPEMVYHDPENVLEDQALTRKDKIEILTRWKYDALEDQVAEEENMGGVGDEKTEALFDRIAAALIQLKAAND